MTIDRCWLITFEVVGSLTLFNLLIWACCWRNRLYSLFLSSLSFSWGGKQIQSHFWNNLLGQALSQFHVFILNMIGHTHNIWNNYTRGHSDVVTPVSHSTQTQRFDPALHVIICMWLTWDLNPQSPAPEGVVLSIRPLGLYCDIKCQDTEQQTHTWIHILSSIGRETAWYDEGLPFFMSFFCQENIVINGEKGESM